MSCRTSRLLVLSLAVIAGCSNSNRLPVYPVSGTVLVNGRPAAGARVFFHPAADATNPRALRPFAVAGSDGSFRLTTYMVNDGAPAGEYVVTVTWPPPRPAGGADEGVAAPDRLNGAFATPAVSKLRATVASRPNSLEPLRLP